ncbi:MAG: DNA helicase RecQ [Melioribacteraceae bacterium]|nr:DNA helicase RecQ [Melioribacteraceae bacterium]MCF8356356.1 DNA helicase RecQ [Melioribacteraceae bacterium]MCF8395795.1 DNA helicase RecQ [Melioribacteraceae bacterium]MCF8420660.1 DNA helicase RecQ [Melioribacteraceae bacterium]
MIKQARQILETTFGYKSFRPLQEEVIDSILNKKDTLVIMPTGGGKSLCYQIPALIFDGITVVVSPLISLMKDQVEQLVELGIESVFLNSSLTPQQYAENVERLKSGKIKLLYLAPETLFLERTIALLKNLSIECITVDEAHCISEWGHDFRPEYRKIIEVREIFPKAVCAAVTATATPRVQRDIQDSLKLSGNNKFVASFDRENLYLEITPKTNGVDQTMKFLRKYPNQSGIIYCFSRKQVDSLSMQLDDAGYSVRPYHAGLSDKERHENQELFIKDDIQIIVATIAFGMGINKSNVRFVIHFDLPKNIESYYQEIGRAGRDGLRSHCLLLFSYSDIQKIRYFINQKEAKEKQIAERHLSALIDYAETGICRRFPLLSYFGENFTKDKCGICDNCNSTDKDLVDATIPAQKFLSCVKRTGEMFGAGYIIDVLMGSGSSRIIEKGHDKLSTYGIGKEYTKKQWLNLSHQFLQLHLLSQNNEYGSLILTEKAYDILKGELTVNCKIKEDFEVRTVMKTDANYDAQLFDLLRRKRKEIADKLSLPPYVIFSDKTLTEMSTYLPVNKKEMIRIHGLGEIKFQKYGHVFLNLIMDYCEKNNLKPVGDKSYSSKPPIKIVKKKSFQSTGEKFNSGMSIRDICLETKYKKSTILRHLLDFVNDNNLIDHEKLLEESELSMQQIKNVLNKFDEIGSERLSPVYEAFNQKIEYNELHLLRIYHLAKSTA